MTEQEFNQLILPLHKKLYGYAFAILRDEAEAADCIQEVYCRLWESRDRLGLIKNREAYCIVSVKRTAIDHLRKRDVSPYMEEIQEQLRDSSPPPDVVVAGKEISGAVDDILDMLPQRQKDILKLSAFDGLSNPEIEKVTGLSGDNVRVLLSRGRKRFRELFDKWNSN